MQLAVSPCLKESTKVRRYQQATAVVPGSVLVFVENGVPKHSCVAMPGMTLGGYNQTGWFTTMGIQGGYSSHPMSEIMWLGGVRHRHEVRGSNESMVCQLIAVPERSALAVLRQAVQR